MSGIGITISLFSLLVAMVALWMVWRSREELSSIKRERYYLEQKVKALSPLIEAKIEPLRIQTALLAQGKSTSTQLIRTGKLYHEISAKEAEGLLSGALQNDRMLWLDVRTAAEFSKRHVSGAQLLPVEELEMRYQAEIPQTVERIMVYCAGGDRSRLACDFLSRHDFGNVYYIKDGLQGWAGPTEGNDTSGLIQIASKAKLINQVDTTVSTAARS